MVCVAQEIGNVHFCFVLLSERCIAESLCVVVTQRAIRSLSVWFWQPVKFAKSRGGGGFTMPVRSCAKKAKTSLEQARASAGTGRRWSTHVSARWLQSELTTSSMTAPSCVLTTCSTIGTCPPDDRQPSVSVFDDMFDDMINLVKQDIGAPAVDGGETAIKRFLLKGKQPISAVPRHWRRLRRVEASDSD